MKFTDEGLLARIFPHMFMKIFPSSRHGPQIVDHNVDYTLYLWEFDEIIFILMQIYYFTLYIKFSEFLILCFIV